MSIHISEWVTGCFLDALLGSIFVWVLTASGVLVYLLVTGFSWAALLGFPSIFAVGVGLMMLFLGLLAGISQVIPRWEDCRALAGGRKVTARMVWIVASELGSGGVGFVTFRDEPVEVRALEDSRGDLELAGVSLDMPGGSPVSVFSGTGSCVNLYRPGLWEGRILELYRRAHAVRAEREAAMDTLPDRSLYRGFFWGVWLGLSERRRERRDWFSPVDDVEVFP